MGTASFSSAFTSFLCLSLLAHIAASNEDIGTSSNSETKTPSEELLQSDIAFKESVKHYQKLFKLKRVEQLSAVKSILSMQDPKKRKIIIDSLAQAMRTVLLEARPVIEASGFSPGDAFPKDDHRLKETISRILENTALFCEMTLRLPKPMKRLLDDDVHKSADGRQLNELINWALVFSNSTNFYDDATRTLVNLAAQELGILEKTAQFVNPYAEPAPVRATFPPTDDGEKKENAKKKDRFKNKGPRLTGAARSDL